jgi:hypothetical protein
VTFATLPVRDALPSDLLPFMNFTVPVGVGPAELTVAVRVAAWPYVDGFKLETRVVLVGYCLTTCLSALEFRADGIMLTQPPKTGPRKM